MGYLELPLSERSELSLMPFNISDVSSARILWWLLFLRPSSLMPGLLRLATTPLPTPTPPLQINVSVRSVPEACCRLAGGRFVTDSLALFTTDVSACSGNFTAKPLALLRRESSDTSVRVLSIFTVSFFSKSLAAISWMALSRRCLAFLLNSIIVRRLTPDTATGSATLFSGIFTGLSGSFSANALFSPVYMNKHRIHNYNLCSDAAKFHPSVTVDFMPYYVSYMCQEHFC